MKFTFQKGAWASKSARRRIRDVRPEAVEKVAVIRHAALGDMVITRPFLIEARKCFPNARLTLSVVTRYQNGVPEDLVDQVHVQYGNDRKDVPLREQYRRARQLGEQDFIFDLASTPRSLYLNLVNRAQFKIGFPYHHLQRMVFDATVFRTDFKYEGDVMLDMLHMLGHVSRWPPEFALPGEAIKEATPYIVYFNGASKQEKCWPKARFRDLVRELAGRHRRYNHYLLEGKGKWESIDEDLEALRDVDNIKGLKGLKLDPTIEWIKGAALVVSNDTGIRHLAVAAGVPTVGIFQPINPYRYWPRYGIHEVVFSTEAEWPEVRAVAQATDTLLARLEAAAT